MCHHLPLPQTLKLVLQNEKRRVYDGMDIVQERDQYNTVTASITRAGNIGGILARTTNGGSIFYAYDGGGNVTTLTNSAGAQVGSYTYGLGQHRRAVGRLGGRESVSLLDQGEYRLLVLLTSILASRQTKPR